MNFATSPSTTSTRTSGAFRVIALMAMTLLVAPTSFAATFTVSTLADHGPGSLRAAIASATAGDSVLFAPSLIGTIELESTLTVDKSVAIDGARRIVLDGGHARRVLHVLAPAAVTLSGLTVQHGLSDTGAGILNEGQLLVMNCLVRDNSATIEGGGIAHFGLGLTLIDAEVIDNEAQIGGGGLLDVGQSITYLLRARVAGNRASGNGAGIRQRSGQVLTITDSAIVGNHGDLAAGVFGGGIAVESSELRMSHSTVNGNRATVGGGLYVRRLADGMAAKARIDASLIANNTAQFDGGGVAVGGAGVELYNTTVSQNLAAQGTGGGIIAFSLGGGTSQYLVLTQDTIAFNAAPNVPGGGVSIFSLSTVMFRTIVADNVGALDPDMSGEFSSTGYNLVHDRGGSTGYAVTDLPQLTPAKLMPLFYVGGATSAHDLMPDSPAIDAIPPAVCEGIEVDQRDYPRPMGAGCDIGAIEYGAPPIEAVFGDGFE